MKLVPLLETNDTYFDTLGQAIDAAKEYATKKGYEVIENDTLMEPCNYGHTCKYQYALTKGGKPQKKMLQVSIYRMDSGKYELTQYIN
jgi:hypothetical protein